MISIFNSNNFSIEFTNYGGVAPSKNFLDNLDNIKMKLDDIKNKYFSKDKIWEDISRKNLIDDIHKLPLELTIYSKIFNILHSRIGSKVTEHELKYTSPTATFDHGTKMGTICIHSPREMDNRFVLYLGNSETQPSYAKIITTTTPIYSLEDRETAQVNSDEVPFTEVKYYYSNVLNLYIVLLYLQLLALQYRLIHQL
jgi:hypothetical protein